MLSKRVPIPGVSGQDSWWAQAQCLPRSADHEPWFAVGVPDSGSVDSLTRLRGRLILLTLPAAGGRPATTARGC